MKFIKKYEELDFSKLNPFKSKENFKQDMIQRVLN
jgi:hypothetical protein